MGEPCAGDIRVQSESAARSCNRDNDPAGKRAPRLHGELLKLGIEVSQATVAKYMVKHRKPPSQTWRTFLENHVKQLVSVDFFVVPTLSFRILYVFLVLAHERRRVVHFNVTEQPTAEWAAAQLKQAFPWDTAPSYILRDRDRVYGKTFRTLAADNADHGSAHGCPISLAVPSGQSFPSERCRIWAGLSPCRKSAGFTIDTNAEPHKLSTFGDLAPAGEFSWLGAAWKRTSSGTLVS